MAKNCNKWVEKHNKLQNAIPAENASSVVVQNEDENVLVKPLNLRRKEMLNGLYQWKESKWSKQCKPRM